MTTWIALLRGVNVGGKNKLPMADLTAALASDGFSAVKTYIQSGNVVFQASTGTADSIAKSIGDTVQKRFGFRPHILVLSGAELARAVAENPFPEGIDIQEGKLLHLFILDARPANIDEDGLNSIKLASESWACRDRFFYLFTPDGFGNSKLATRAERLLGVPATARNWRSVVKILELSETSSR